MMKKKKKETEQITMYTFLKRVTPPQELQAGPSGAIPEGGVVIIGDDRSMHDIAPEDLPVGQEVEVEDSE